MHDNSEFSILPFQSNGLELRSMEKYMKAWKCWEKEFRALFQELLPRAEQCMHALG